MLPCKFHRAGDQHQSKDAIRSITEHLTGFFVRVHAGLDSFATLDFPVADRLIWQNRDEPRSRIPEMEYQVKQAKAGTVILQTLAAGITLLLLLAVRAGSAESGPVLSGTMACEGFAYTVDSDQKGTNVRSAPHMTAPVLFVIPYDSEGSVVGLSASSGDWVLIHSARGATSGFESGKRGWVHSSLLAVRAVHPSGRAVPLYSESHSGSRVITMLSGEPEARLTGCSGAWKQVRIGKKRGWLAPGDSCGNPVTTCP